MLYSELMSDFETDERDFAADSWSLAVDSSFLQQQKKEVMKQQDVIYGEPRPPMLLLLPGPVVCDLPPARAPPSKTPASSPRVAIRPPPFGALGLPGPIFTPSFKSVLRLCSRPFPRLAPCGKSGREGTRGSCPKQLTA